MPDTPQKWAAMTLFYRTLIQVDPVEAVNLAKNLPERHRISLAQQMVAVAPPRSMGEITKLLLTLPESDNSGCTFDYVGDAMNEWSVADPVGAGRLIDERPEELRRYCAPVAGNWAAVDPMAAKVWLDRQYRSQGEVRVDSSDFTSWMNGFFQYDRSSAIEFAVDNQGDHLLRGGIQSIAEQVYQKEPNDAEKLVAKLRGPARSAALEGIVSAVSDNAPSRLQAGEAIFQSTANWLLEFEPHEWDEALSSLISRWNGLDQPAFLSWLSQLPMDLRPQIAAKYPSWNSSVTPEQVNRITALPDLKVHDQILEVIMTHSQYQREEALAALDQAGLSASEKAHFASLIPEKDETP